MLQVLNGEKQADKSRTRQETSMRRDREPLAEPKRSPYSNQALLRMGRAGGMPPVTPLRPSQTVFLQRKCACSSPTSSLTGESEEFKGNKRLQAKLTVGASNDPLEQEADRVAEQVMRMPDPEPPVSAAPPQIGRKCASCEEEEAKKLQTKPTGTSEAAAGGAPTSVHTVLSSPGQPLDLETRAFMEPRFGHDFSQVRVHTDARAADSARAVNALAYTMGSDIVFETGKFAPGTSGGDKLLAHELTHVIQQQNNKFESSEERIQRTAATCPTDWNTTVGDDHNRALGMIDTARTKLSSYDGTSPPEVKTALDTHFKASGTGFASWVNFNLGFLRGLAPLASYDCEDTSSWWCDPNTNAKTFWCVPFVDIRVCQPKYFGHSDIERSRILIHEWVHKYGCNFDLGYRDNPDYPKQWTVTALLNADPFAQFVKDVQ